MVYGDADGGVWLQWCYMVVLASAEVVVVFLDYGGEWRWWCMVTVVVELGANGRCGVLWL